MSHIRRLLSVTDTVAREWYLLQASEDMWSVRTLDRNIFAAKYMTYMPTEEELRREIERQKQFFLDHHKKE